MNTLLRTVLRLNAISCMSFGIVFLLCSESTAKFLDDFTFVDFRLIGGALFVNGIHLLLGSLRKEMKRLEIAYFILGDLLWVVGSLILIGVGAIFSVSAVAATLGVTVLVGTLGYLQWRWGRSLLLPKRGLS